MEKDDIRINRGIIHILDSTMAAPVLSDMPFDTGSDFCDFLKGHIYKLISGDDLKTCHFNEGESQVISGITVNFSHWLLYRFESFCWCCSMVLLANMIMSWS